VGNTLLRRDRLGQTRPIAARPASANSDNEAGIRPSVERLNAEFRGRWKEQGLTPAPLASDLTIARRLSLALVGTLPSLEEIRALEAQPPGERLPWFSEHLRSPLCRLLGRVVGAGPVGNEQATSCLRRRGLLWLADKTEGMPMTSL
jgi:hypothetical protein